MMSIGIGYRLALLMYTICDVISGPSALPVTSPSTLDSDVTWFPSPTNSSPPLCPPACRCTVTRLLSGSRRRISAACDRPIHDDDRFDPETEAVRVTGNCHRSFASVMASVGELSTPRQLSLRRCHLYTVEELLLVGESVNWATVFDLDVGFNLITGIAGRAFVKMFSLRSLILRHNRIESIDRDAFEGLNDLVRLDLTGNRLSMVTWADMRWLCALRSLDELSLRDNGVHVLAAAGFHCRPTPCPLRRLDLGENRIRRVDDEAFAGLSNITRLILDSSQLTTVPTAALLRLSASLRELDLSGNRMEALFSHSFRDLATLRFLRLNRVSTLRFVSRSCFVNLTSLESVELSGNAALRYIDREAFLDTPNVANVSLSGCGMTSVDRQLAGNLFSLNSLDLRLNPISCDCHAKWMRQSNVTRVDPDVWRDCNVIPDGAGCPPRIAELFDTDLDVPVTNTFTLYCRAVGFPPPKISWILPHLLHSNSSAQVQYCPLHFMFLSALVCLFVR